MTVKKQTKKTSITYCTVLVGRLFTHSLLDLLIAEMPVCTALGIMLVSAEMNRLLCLEMQD